MFRVTDEPEGEFLYTETIKLYYTVLYSSPVPTERRKNRKQNEARNACVDSTWMDQLVLELIPHACIAHTRQRTNYIFCANAQCTVRLDPTF